MVDGRSERIESKQRKECCWINEMRASKFDAKARHQPSSNLLAVTVIRILWHLLALQSSPRKAILLWRRFPHSEGVVLV
jgi:hypothetical protein